MTGKKQPVGDVAEWTGASRDRVYALLAGGMIGDALDDIARYPGLRMNDLAPVDATALTCFESHLAKDPGIKGVLLAALHHDSQPIRRGARFLAMRVLENPLEDLLEEIARLNASVVEENRKVTERVSAKLDREIARGETPADERQWHIRQEERHSFRKPSPGEEEFAQFVASLAFATSKTEELEKVANATTPPFPKLYHDGLLTANLRKVNADWAKARAARGAKPRKDKATKAKPLAKVKGGDPRLQQLLADGDLSELLPYMAGLADSEGALRSALAEIVGPFADRIIAMETLRDEFFEALLSSDDALRGAALALMNSIPRFPFEQFLQRLYREIDGRGHEYADADRDRFKEVAVATARAHGVKSDFPVVRDWPRLVTNQWDWRSPIIEAIASRYSLDQVVDWFRSPELAGTYDFGLLDAHREADPDLSLFSLHGNLSTCWGDDSLIGKAIHWGRERRAYSDRDVFGGRPDLSLNEHLEDLAVRLCKDSAAILRTRDWNLIMDWAWSVYMGDGGFTRVEKELWPTFAKEALAYCLEQDPDAKWFSALSLYMMGAKGPDVRLIEKRREALPPAEDTSTYNDQYHLLFRFGEAPKQKDWWLPFLKLEWEHFLTNRKCRTNRQYPTLCLHDYSERIAPFRQQSIQFGSPAYEDALRAILARMDGVTLLEKLTRTPVSADYGGFHAAICAMATEEEAVDILRHGESIDGRIPFHALAWRLRETRAATVREFLRRWQKGHGHLPTVNYMQREAIEVFVAQGLFTEEVTQRIAASLEAKDEEEFNWAFDLAFAYPEMMTAQGVDVLELVAPRIHRPAKRQVVSDTIRRMMLLGRYGRTPKDRVFAALEEAFQLDDPAIWKKAAESMREFKKEQPELALSNPDRVKDLIERDPKKYAAIFKGLV